jgi:hypothetical protein
MGTNNTTPEINFEAIHNEISKMTPEQMQAELLKTRVRQKKQQKKQQGSGAQKAYQMKQRERMRLLKAEAIKLGLWDKINEQAEQQAERELSEEGAPEVDEVDA